MHTVTKYIAVLVVFVGCSTPRTTSTGVQRSDVHSSNGISAAHAKAREARALLLGEGVAQDRVGAMDLFFEACTQGDPRACYTLLQLPNGSARRAAIATRELWAHCTRGDLRSCYAFIENDLKLSVPVSPGELKRGCDANVPAACTFYSVAIDGTPESSSVASKACRLGDPIACFFTLEPASPPASREAALKTFRAGCEADVPMFCAWLHSDEGEKQFRERMLRHCLELDLTACSYARNIESREAHIGAAKILCRLDMKACESLHTDVAFNYEVVAIDPEEAARAYERFCLDGMDRDGVKFESAKRARDCVSGANLLLSKEWPGQPEHGRADALLTQACALDLKALPRDDRSLVEMHCAGAAKVP